MQLDWTGALKNTNAARQTISAEFLEPFSSSGSACSGYSTCLGCSTDTSCGWCDGDTSSSCIARSSASVDQCVASSASLVLNSVHCPVCADHVDCSSCVQVGCRVDCCGLICAFLKMYILSRCQFFKINALLFVCPSFSFCHR
jgi:hypothetical protein